MTQHALTIANQAGASFRTDLVNALQALGGNQSGASAPGTTYAYMFWADTTAGLLKIRNAANSAWITIGTLASAALGLAAAGVNADITSLTGLTGPINEAQGSNIASAATVNLTTATGNYVHVTGTTTITAITLAQGAERTVVFDGALTLTNGASLILPGAANIATAAGDVAMFRGEASGVVRCVEYQPAALPFVSYKAVSFTRDMSLASGTQAITGVGFKPRAVSFIAGHATGAANIASWGYDDGSSHLGVQWDNANNAGAFASDAPYSLSLVPQAGTVYRGVIQSFDSDGFTINWTKVASPTGTVTVYALCYR